MHKVAGAATLWLKSHTKKSQKMLAGATGLEPAIRFYTNKTGLY